MFDIMIIIAVMWGVSWLVFIISLCGDDYRHEKSTGNTKYSKKQWTVLWLIGGPVCWVVGGGLWLLICIIMLIRLTLEKIGVYKFSSWFWNDVLGEKK